MYQIATKTDLDSLDIVHLEEVANQCPLEGGIAVLQARTHLWPYTGLKYINECELLGWEYGDGERRANITQSTPNVLAEPSALVYPNPANTELYIELLNCDSAQIEIFDISGRICLKENLNTMNSLDVSLISKGLYIYKLTSKGELIKAGRLVITK